MSKSNAERKNTYRAQTAGSLLLLALCLAAIIQPYLSAYRYDEVALGEIHRSPDAKHWMGTDELGRDFATRVMMGARLSLVIALAGAAMACGLGALIGAVSGYYGGRFDEWSMRVVDLQLSVPLLPVLIVISAFTRPSVAMLISFLALFAWMEPARITRAEALRLREESFVTAARALGASGGRVVSLHILPNAFGPLSVAAALLVGRLIVLESVLSFLGLGVQPPFPSLGSLLYGAQNALASEPWLALFPGIWICLLVLSVNLLGDALNRTP